MNENTRSCGECRTGFLPDKYHPHQQYCKNCGRIVKKKKMREWRKNNPDYHTEYMKEYYNI